MRDLEQLEQYRNHALELKAYGPGAALGAHKSIAGCFEVPSKVDGQTLRIILSKGQYGWDHASISKRRRTPTWGEMEYVRRLFFEDHEAVMQYHAPIAEYVDGSVLGHPYCLHLWRPLNEKIPSPPKWMVGGMTIDEADKAAKKDGF